MVITVRCNCYNFELKLSINSKWVIFWDCVINVWTTWRGATTRNGSTRMFRQILLPLSSQHKQFLSRHNAPPTLWQRFTNRYGVISHTTKHNTNLSLQMCQNYRDADRFLARTGCKQARKHARDARDFNNIEIRAVIRSPPYPARQGADGNSRHSDRNISLLPSWSG